MNTNYYTDIFDCVAAYFNCINSKNTDWKNKWEEKINSCLLEILPHGSGIDSDWSIEISPNFITLSNSYHCMNDSGYTHWIDFSIRLKPDYSFTMHGKFKSDLTLRDYLDEIFDCCFCDHRLRLNAAKTLRYLSPEELHQIAKDLTETPQLTYDSELSVKWSCLLLDY